MLDRASNDTRHSMYDYELLYLEVSAIDEVHRDLFESKAVVEEAVLLVVDHRQLLSVVVVVR